MDTPQMAPNEEQEMDPHRSSSPSETPIFCSLVPQYNPTIAPV